jgi:hypothetical protein
MPKCRGYALRHTQAEAVPPTALRALPACRANIDAVRRSCSSVGGPSNASIQPSREKLVCGDGVGKITIDMHVVICQNVLCRFKPEIAGYCGYHKQRAYRQRKT